jgi:transposase
VVPDGCSRWWRRSQYSNLLKPFLGVHFTIKVDGTVKIGPTATSLPSGGKTMAVSRDFPYPNDVKNMILPVFTRWGKPGIRAQLLNTKTKTLGLDFLVEGDRELIHVLNAVSPAFTDSLPFDPWILKRYRTGCGGDPTANGFAAELWTLSAFVHGKAEEAGFSRLMHVPKMTIGRILDAANIKPHRIRYYLEKRDPDFDRKMAEVLMVYQEVNLKNDRLRTGEDEPENAGPVITVSIDEKPGIQAIQNTASDLPPKPGSHAEVGRDYEYIRHGTLSLLAALDLHTGEVIANVEERHRSQEFVSLLKRLDDHYPKEATIRVVLDNHSAHISKETFAYLATRPNRFEYVHTPKHGSWLNLVETAFSKMARTFLRHIRVSTKEELKTRILKGIAEWNQKPVVFRWSNFDLGLK